MKNSYKPFILLIIPVILVYIYQNKILEKKRQLQSTANYIVDEKRQLQSTANYIVYENGTVKDKQTGLIWMRCSEGLSGMDCSIGRATSYTWQEAIEHANKVSFAYYSDWRVPTIEELRSLVYCSNGIPKETAWEETCSSNYGRDIDDHTYDYTYQLTTINKVIFPHTHGRYWSASTYVRLPENAWIVAFYSGSVSAYDKLDDGFVSLRLVRGKSHFKSLNR